MPAPATQKEKHAPTRKTIRNLLKHTIPVPEGPQREHANGDLIELGLLAMGRGLSLAATSRTSAHLPDSDTFHHHLHATTPQQVYEAGTTCLRAMLGIPAALGWLKDPCDVAVDRHNEPHYSKKSGFAVRMKNTRGTTRAHAYLTSQRLNEPRLTLDLQLLNPFRDQHAALKDLVAATQAVQEVGCWFLDKGFYNRYDVQTLLESRSDFVVAVPKSKATKRLERDLYAARTRTGARTFLASARHQIAAPGGPRVTLIFTWQPDEDEPTGESYYVYAVPHDAPVAVLLKRTQQYRRRFGIESGYRSFERLRLRTTTNHYANRLYLTLMAMLAYNAWRILRHARTLRNPRPPPYSLPEFQIDMAREPLQAAA